MVVRPGLVSSHQWCGMRTRRIGGRVEAEARADQRRRREKWEEARADKRRRRGKREEASKAGGTGGGETG
eukprot:750785-Hanusia_phi.AAC.1